MGMKILVTGAAGFIGSHLCERLLAEGSSVIGLDNLDPFYAREFKEENLRILGKHGGFTFHESDIRSPDLGDIVGSEKPDMIVHLAAMAGVRPSIEDPEKYISVNVGGTYNLLDAARKNDVGSFIFASSSSVYGGNRKLPFSETDGVDNPVSPYAATKKAGELLCHTYHHLYGMDVTCLRFFTVYGPRQRPEMAVYSFTEKIFGGEKVPLFSMGKSKRDYTFIDDIVEGIVLSMNNMGGYRIYNLGESKVTDLLELVSIIERATGKKARAELLPHQPGDMMVTYADVSRAREELGYNPKWSVEKGIEVFVDWYGKKRKKEA